LKLAAFLIFFQAKYGVDSMMHHQLNKLTDLTRDPAGIPLNLWELDLGSSLAKFWLIIAQSIMGKISRISLTPDPSGSTL